MHPCVCVGSSTCCRYVDAGQQVVEYFSCLHLSPAAPPLVVVVDQLDALYSGSDSEVMTRVIHTLSLIVDTLSTEWLIGSGAALL